VVQDVKPHAQNVVLAPKVQKPQKVPKTPKNVISEKGVKKRPEETKSTEMCL
jgi:hypothetical protein